MEPTRIVTIIVIWALLGLLVALLFGAAARGNDS
jgi:hypothetical protein